MNEISFQRLNYHDIAMHFSEGWIRWELGNPLKMLFNLKCFFILKQVSVNTRCMLFTWVCYLITLLSGGKHPASNFQNNLLRKKKPWWNSSLLRQEDRSGTGMPTRVSHVALDYSFVLLDRHLYAHLCV